MSSQFIDNSSVVKAAIENAVAALLEEAGGEWVSQAKQNTRVDTSQTKGSWGHIVEVGKSQVTVGNMLENAIWEEFGTGIYAIYGNGRKSPWVYVDRHGVFHRTQGKRPSRAFHRATQTVKKPLQNRANEIMAQFMGGD